MADTDTIEKDDDTLPPEESTDELERRSLASHINARPIATAQPEPTSGTADLEKNAALSQGMPISAGQEANPTPHSLPLRSGVASLWTKADNIQNPVLRVLGKIGAGAARAIDTAGMIAAPGIESAIPGTQGNAVMQRKAANADTERTAKQAQEQATLEHTQATTEDEKAQTAQRTAPKAPAPKEEKWDVFPGYTDSDGTPLMREENSGQVVRALDRQPPQAFKAAEKNEKPDSIDQQYNEAIARGDHAAAARLLQVKTDLAKAGQSPERPERPPRTMMVVPQPDGSQKVIEVTPNMTIPGNAAKPGEAASASRKDISAHDKAYVQPAEAVEKSYQMSDQAYKEYQAAKAEGKDLPTGAQSMVQLSTHLSTTFGNVKGARITKDMIQEHMGARSVSDGALVAIQKLTNGDPLSPDQWDAFHDLIGKSRQLTWQIAAKEADRKHIPVDFLPKDLEGMAHEPGDLGHSFIYNGKKYQNVPDELYKKYKGKNGFSE